MISKETIRYPVKGSVLFSEKGNNNEIAWLQRQFQEFHSYANSYQIGALTLLDDCIEIPDKRDSLIYPINFLIRHYLELRIKEWIQGMNYVNKQSRDFPNGHDIQWLWKEFKKKYNALGEDVSTESFLAMDSIILEISNIDPVSMSFRYPVDKQGNKIQKLEHINVKDLRETFIRISFMFDGIALQIGHYVDMTEAMMSELYSMHSN